MGFIIATCRACNHRTRIPEFGKAWTCERCGAGYTVTTSAPADPLPDHWLENFRALLTIGGDCDNPPYPAELKVMEAAGVVIWYDYWNVTWEGHAAIFAEIDRLRKLVG